MGEASAGALSCAETSCFELLAAVYRPRKAEQPGGASIRQTVALWLLPSILVSLPTVGAQQPPCDSGWPHWGPTPPLLNHAPGSLGCSVGPSKCSGLSDLRPAFSPADPKQTESSIFLPQNGFTREQQRIVTRDIGFTGNPRRAQRTSAGTLFYRGKGRRGALQTESALEETGSWKCRGFSLVERLQGGEDAPSYWKAEWKPMPQVEAVSSCLV